MIIDIDCEHRFCPTKYLQSVVTHAYAVYKPELCHVHPIFPYGSNKIVDFSQYVLEYVIIKLNFRLPSQNYVNKATVRVYLIALWPLNNN